MTAVRTIEWIPWYCMESFLTDASECLNVFPFPCLIYQSISGSLMPHLMKNDIS